MKGADACGCFPTGRHYPGIAHLLRVVAAGVAEEIAADASWIDEPIAFLDTETTGRDPTLDRIVEIGIIVGRYGIVQARYNWLVNPGMPIPEGASAVHGISDDDVRDAPKLEQIIGDVLMALQGAIPAAYNANFDRSFLTQEIKRMANPPTGALPPAIRDGVEWLDPLVWARHIQKYEKGKSLGEVTARLGIKLENAHRASDDAEAALLVLYEFAKDSRVPRAYGQLVQEQRRLWRMQEEEFSRWRNRNPTPPTS
jgi:DNA polymerase-3 subunit epsilon